MTVKRTKNPLVKLIFKDNYDRKIWGYFGDKTSFRNNWHRGVDYGAEVGEKMYALEDGIVTFVQNGGNTQLEKDFGKFVGIYYPKWNVTVVYSHCHSLIAKVNTRVKKGELVATSGQTGKVQGPHVDVMIANGRRIRLQTVYNNAFDFDKYKPVVQNKKKSVEEVAREVLLGQWGNDPQRSKDLKKAGYDPKAVQAEVNRHYGAKPKPQAPKPSPIQKGDRVEVINNVQYTGGRFAVYDKTYLVTEVSGDRVVIASTKNGRTVTIAAVNRSNLRKA